MVKRTKDNETPEQDPILAPDPTVTIAGVEYPLRRLGLVDTFRVVRILGRGVAILTDAGDGATPGQVVQVLVASMTQNQDEVLSLLADLLRVKRSELEDPERFPMESIIDVFEALSQHQDLKAFLARVQALTQRLPEMQTLSGARSTS